DVGVQDTGTDGAPWALAIRGAPPDDTGELALAWTLRGAPHAYRRSDLAAVAVSTAPYSEADALKRIFDAAKPLKAAGIPAIEALTAVAKREREIVTEPTVKGELSGRLTSLLDEPYVRFCRPCNTTHCHEQTFRLAALQAGLEIEGGTSPPVLRRTTGLRPPLLRRLAGEAEERFDVIRNYLRFYGPARVRDVAAYIDAPLGDVRAHWPADAVEVDVADVAAKARPEPRFALADDVEEFASGVDTAATDVVRLVGPHDPYVQLRDRETLVADEQRRKDLWRALGRPGAVIAGGDVLGTWRPRTSGRRLTISVEPWAQLGRKRWRRIEEQAERLASHRGASTVSVAAD
ncbi:MAG: DNA glycosylase AlkZ-like family protein, partial [Acidimicrobiales bacterium]